MQLSFPTTVLYTQITAHLLSLPRPGLLWNDDDVAQGFAWNDGIVAFGVPDHDGECLIEVDTDSPAVPMLSAATLWAVAVPFEATEPDLVVGTVLDGRPCTISPGRYRLTFEARAGEAKAGEAKAGEAKAGEARDGGDSYAYRCTMLFTKDANPNYAILKQGPLLSGRVLHPQAPYA